MIATSRAGLGLSTACRTAQAGVAAQANQLAAELRRLGWIAVDGNVPAGAAVCEDFDDMTPEEYGAAVALAANTYGWFNDGVLAFIAAWNRAVPGTALAVPGEVSEYTWDMNAVLAAARDPRAPINAPSSRNLASIFGNKWFWIIGGLAGLGAALIFGKRGST